MVMDQKHLINKSRAVDELNPDNNACLMVLERRDGPGVEYVGYRRVPSSPQSLPDDIARMLRSLSLQGDKTTVITSDQSVASFARAGATVVADRHLVCAAPFVALSQAVKPAGDYLLLTRDDRCLYGVGFRSSEM
jgi:hypothetical protein